MCWSERGGGAVGRGHSADSDPRCKQRPHASVNTSTTASGHFRVCDWPKRKQTWAVSEILGLRKVKHNMSRIAEVYLIGNGQDPVRLVLERWPRAEATLVVASLVF